MAQGATKDPWAPCIASVIDDDTPSGGAGAPFYPKLRWDKKQLKVAFLNDIPQGKLKTPTKKVLDTAKILEWANVWSSEELGLKGTVPEFVPWRKDDPGQSDIRVKFLSQGGSESLIGTTARDHLDTHSMALNLSHDSDDYRQYLVIHEFGHALGLGHEHQMARLAGALDEAKMIKVLQQWQMNRREARLKFRQDSSYYSKCAAPKEGTEFDPWSVMCYPIPVECVKKSYRTHFTDEQFKKITTQDYEKRKNLSKIDISTIKSLYSTGTQREDEDEKKDEEAVTAPAKGGDEGVKEMKEVATGSSKQQDKPSAKQQDKPPTKQQDKSPTKQQDKPPTKQQDKSPTKQQDKSPTKRQDKTPTKQQDNPPTDSAPTPSEPAPKLPQLKITLKQPSTPSPPVAGASAKDRQKTSSGPGHITTLASAWPPGSGPVTDLTPTRPRPRKDPTAPRPKLNLTDYKLSPGSLPKLTDLRKERVPSVYSEALLKHWSNTIY